MTLDLFAAEPRPVPVAAPFVPTREEGLRRLRDFLPRAGSAYASTRNHDQGPGRRNVSVLSPHLRHRLVTEEEVVRAVLARHSLEGAEKFVQEVFWRTYWKGHLEMRPSLWTVARGRAARLHADLDAAATDRLAAAEEGRTGIACFDAWAAELVETGFLHNHTRMWFASIWIFTLRLPWELGADFFLRHLIDADPASNTLSWRWVAGLHTTGKHYVARADNIAKYTNGRFDPRGDLARDPEPLTEATDHPAGPLRRPEPPRPGLASVLLLTEDDLHPESLDPPWSDIRAVIAFAAPDARSARPVGEPARRFARDAVRLAAERVGAARGLPVECVDAAAAPSEIFVDLCRRHGATQVVSAFLPVGWTGEALAPARSALVAAGFGFTEILRPWDARAWPHAKRGFFPFKEHIPALCAGLA